jgi:hypothetical protein
LLFNCKSADYFARTSYSVFEQMMMMMIDFVLRNDSTQWLKKKEIHYTQGRIQYFKLGGRT